LPAVSRGGIYAPEFFPSPLHGIGHDLVQLIGRFARGADRSHARRDWLSLAYFAPRKADDLRDRVNDVAETADMRGVLDRAFKIMGLMGRPA